MVKAAVNGAHCWRVFVDLMTAGYFEAFARHLQQTRKLMMTMRKIEPLTVSCGGEFCGAEI